MTAKQIDAQAAAANVKFVLAKQIREMLDAAAKSYGKDDWETDDVEAEICQLVFED